jgi:hypothetical protein
MPQPRMKENLETVDSNCVKKYGASYTKGT